MKGGLKMPQVIKMDTIILYHGSPNKIVTPIFGGGDDKHDYGRGFYLTENIDLAKEWAVCRPNEQNGWVHKYVLNTEELKIFDFQEKDVLSWLAELMKHRDAADSKRYRMLAAKFIDKYGIDIHSMKVENLKNKSMFLEMETYVNKGFQKESLVEEMMNKTYFKMLNYY